MKSPVPQPGSSTMSGCFGSRPKPALPSACHIASTTGRGV